MYNFLKKAFHIEKSEEAKIDDPYLKTIIFQAEKNCQNEKSLKHIKDIINSIIKKDKKTLKELCSMGIPEEVPLLRTIIWKINLKFLDLKVENWSDIISKKRSEYNNMKEAFMMKMLIDKKVQEESSFSHNNIIKKNGDSINEEEESKDSSSKSKNNSKNDVSKSKSSNNMSNLNNLNQKENENKNVSDKNDKKTNLTITRNPTFGKLNEIYNTNLNHLTNENTDNIDVNFEIIREKFSDSILETTNQINFSRNFLNLEIDERKLKKNKKFIFLYNNSNSKDNNTYNKNEAYDEITKTKVNDICKIKHPTDTNVTFHNNNLNDISFLNNEYQDYQTFTDVSIHKNNKINQEINESILPQNINNLENQNQQNNIFINKDNHNNIYSNTNFDNDQKKNVKHVEDISNQINKNSMQTLNPQIQTFKNQREISNDNKNKIKIDFNFSLFDILNKNGTANSNNNISSNKNNDNQTKFLNFKSISNNNYDMKHNHLVQSQESVSHRINLKADNNNKNINNLNFPSIEITAKPSKNIDCKNTFEEKKESNKIPLSNKNNNEKKPKKQKNDFNKPDIFYENLKKNTKISNYEDKALIEEIYKDMKRTHNEYQFISKPSKSNKKEDLINFQLEKILTDKNKNRSNLNLSNTEYNSDFQTETHLDVIARILYIFAKLNKNIRYVQGMNELVSLIYFIILQEEEFDKINTMMESTNQNNKFSSNNEKNLLNKKDLNYEKYKNHLNPGFKKNLDTSSSINASTKLCDLARLEEAEEEKNFFDLNAERKSSNNLNKLINPTCNNEKKNHIYNHVNENQYQKILCKDNAALYNILEIPMESLSNNHEELFGFTSNRLVKPNQKNVNLNLNNNLDKENFNLNKILNKQNIYLTPDISKDKFKNKFNINPNTNIEQNNCNMHIDNNSKQINLINKNIVSSVVKDSKTKNNLYVDKTNDLNKNINENVQRDYEADTFWCFCYLMDQLKYIYLRSEDNKERGIMKKIKNLNNLLNLVDKNLSLHLENINVDITLFSFKWVILLFSQNFNLSDVIRIWDILLVVEPPTDIFYKVYYFSLAIFEYKKNKILGMDFPAVVLQLQNLFDINIANLIAIYKRIMKDSGKKIKKALGY